MYVSEDRLGSPSGVGGVYYPYGENIGNAPMEPGGEGFATYYEDWYGQYYADQRYYNSMSGRFLTPDPAGSSAARRRHPLTWNQYLYADDDPINRNDPTGECPTVSRCLSQGIQVVGGAVQIGAGVILAVSSATAEPVTLGVATLGLIGGVGQIISGAANIGAGITGSESASQAAQTISNVTNPLGYLATLITGNRDYATLASLGFDGLTSASNFYSALNNGLSGNGFSAIQVMTAPLTTIASGGVFIATGVLNGAPADPLSVYTAPVLVSAPLDSVPYAASPLPQTLSSGGDEMIRGEEDDLETNLQPPQRPVDLSFIAVPTGDSALNAVTPLLLGVVNWRQPGGDQICGAGDLL
jgi:RHS repeat-associated protein